MILVLELIFAISVSVCICARFQYWLVGETMHVYYSKDDNNIWIAKALGHWSTQYIAIFCGDASVCDGESE